MAIKGPKWVSKQVTGGFISLCVYSSNYYKRVIRKKNHKLQSPKVPQIHETRYCCKINIKSNVFICAYNRNSEQLGENDSFPIGGRRREDIYLRSQREADSRICLWAEGGGWE